MTTAEIAALFRSTPTLAEPHAGFDALMSRSSARAAEGAPVHLEHAVAITYEAARSALENCRYALQRQIRLDAQVLASLAEASPVVREHGLGWTPADNLATMNSDDPARLLALARAAGDATLATISYDERRFGAYRAINYGDSIVIYHDNDPRRGLDCVSTWDEAADWCATDRPAPLPAPPAPRRVTPAWKRLSA